VEETETNFGLRAESAALKAQNAELMRALSEAERKNDRLRQILETVPGVVWEIEGAPDAPGRVVYVNERAEQILGYRREEWLGAENLWLSIAHPEDRPKLLAIPLEQLPIVTAEHRLLAKDGREVWVEPHVTILRDASGVPVGMGGVALDVTERVKTEQVRAELLERSKGLKTRVDRVTASVPGIVWEVSGRAGTPEHRFTFVSDYATTMIGYLPEEVTGDKEFWRQVTHPEDQERAAREIRAVYEKGTGSVQYRWLARDGRVVWVESTFHVIRDEEGMTVSAYGVTMDITDRKLADEERARLKDEVIHAQAAALEELSTPLIPISADILVMPLIGAVDRARAERVIETLLQGVSRARARFAIIDITGVSSVDTQIAGTLLRAARAVRLLGAEVVLTGIRPEVAQTLVALGTDLQGIATCGSLESGIAYAARRRAELVA
jgi:PAS domain S-box-containing protein